LFFRIKEQWPEEAFSKISGSYGHPYTDNKMPKQNPFPSWVDFYFPSLADEDKYGTDQAAQAELRRIMKEMFGLELE